MEIDAEKLLLSIKSRNPIYNNRLKDHTSKNILEKLWEEIAIEMNCQVWECKNKWTCLRNAYYRYLREQRTKPSLSGGRKKKKWYLADALSFLKPYIHQVRNNVSDCDAPPEVEDLTYEILEVDTKDTLNKSKQSNANINRNSPVPIKRSRILASESKTSISGNSPVVSMQRSRIFASEFLVEPTMIETAAAAQRHKTREDTSENGNTLFFKSLLADYEQLSSRSQRSFRMFMLNKMNELQEEEENEALLASSASSAIAMSNINYPHVTYEKWHN